MFNSALAFFIVLQIIENCPVTDITTTTDDMGHKRVASVVTAMGAIKTKNVINCAGAWAPYIGKVMTFSLFMLRCMKQYWFQKFSFFLNQNLITLTIIITLNLEFTLEKRHKCC